MNVLARPVLAFGLALSLAAACRPAAAQVRAFPQNTLRGTIAFGNDREVVLNGRTTTLVPGSRVRDRDNRIVPADSLAGTRSLVHYTLEIGGAQVRDVWLLRPEEAEIRPWPRTLDEAASWTYDATTMTWTRP